MRLDILSMNDSRPTPPPLPRAQWQVGAILAAKAVHDPATDRLWLEIGQQRFPTQLPPGRTTKPANGERLKLRITHTSPQLTVEAIEPEPHPDIDIEALRRFLPRQCSPAALLANLHWLIRSSDELQTLPPPVQQAIRQLWDALPHSRDLQQPVELKRALKCSGAFREFLLVNQQSAALQKDFKTNLLNLLQQLKTLPICSVSAYLPPGPLPASNHPLQAIETASASVPALETPVEKTSELLQQAEGHLARIHSIQILNHQTAQQGWVNQLIELPLLRQQQPEVLSVKISREATQKNDSPPKWRLEMAIELKQIGQLHVLIWLQDKTLQIQLRSESSTLVTILNDSLESLHNLFSRTGLEVSHISCLYGHPSDTGDTLSMHILDTQA